METALSEYNPKSTEEKWLDNWQKNQIYSQNNAQKEKVLRFRNVSIPIWKPSHGSRT